MTLAVLESLEKRFDDLKGLCISLRSEVAHVKFFQDKLMSNVSEANRMRRIKALRFSRKARQFRWCTSFPEGCLRNAWRIWTKSIERCPALDPMSEKSVEAENIETTDDAKNDTRDDTRKLMRRLSAMSLEAHRGRLGSIGRDDAAELSQVMRKLKLKRNELMARKEDVAVYSAAKRLGCSKNSSHARAEFKRILFGMQPRDDSRGILGSRLVDPYSPFHAGVEAIQFRNYVEPQLCLMRGQVSRGGDFEREPASLLSVRGANSTLLLELKRSLSEQSDPTL